MPYVGSSPSSTNEAHSGLAILHLVIDRDQQGRNYGLAALQAIVALAERTQGCERLSLTVHPEHSVAIALYRSQGFVDDGVSDDGELRMSAYVSAGPTTLV